MKHLTKAAQEWVNEIESAYVLEQHHRLLLIAAAECWDRAQMCRMVIADEGVMITTPRGASRPHPLLAAERDMKLMFSKLMGQLKLDGDGRETVPLPGARSHKRGGNLYAA